MLRRALRKVRPQRALSNSVRTAAKLTTHYSKNPRENDPRFAFIYFIPKRNESLLVIGDNSSPQYSIDEVFYKISISMKNLNLNLKKGGKKLSMIQMFGNVMKTRWTWPSSAEVQLVSQQPSNSDNLLMTLDSTKISEFA